MLGKHMDPDSTAEAGVSESSGSESAAADTGAVDSNVSRALRAVGTIAAQTTVVAALLFYFGWARTQAVLNYFGIDPAVAHLSVNDYVLRSLVVTVRFLVGLGLLGLILLACHRCIATVLGAGHHPRLGNLLFCVFLFVGLLSCTAGVLGFYNWVVYSPRYPFTPIFLLAGVNLVAYGFYIRRHADGSAQKEASRDRNTDQSSSAGRPRSRPDEHGWAGMQATVLLIVDIVLIFWTVAVYANFQGQNDAELLASNLATKPRVVVYAETPLNLTDPHVTIERLPARGGLPQYRYSNLRLLLYSDGRYFLLPDNWKRGHDPVILLREDNGVRFEFYNSP
jgi:hypothetical protein